MKTTEKLYVLIIVMFVLADNAVAFTEGDSNNFFGIGAGASNLVGVNNIFMGADAGYYNDDGYDNSFYGYHAGYYNTSGYRNTFSGYRTGFSNISGDYNTFNGYTAGYRNTAGNYNTFNGSQAGYSNTTGIANTFNGYRAGFSNTEGYFNTFNGDKAGYSNTTGYGNVFLGYRAGYYETGSEKLYIDNSNTSTPLIYGEFDNSFVEVNGDFYVTGNTYVDSDERLKKDINPIESSLEKIMGVKGVTYKWNKDKHTDRQKAARRHFGVIAQQVEEVLPEIIDKGDDGKRRVAYIELIPVIIEAMKEQQESMNEQQETIIKLSEKVQSLERELKLKGSLAMADIN